MSLFSIQIDCFNETFSNVIIFNYDNVILDFGLEATANLLNAFNTELIENLEKNLDLKYRRGTHSSIVDGHIKIISNNNDFQKFVKKLVDALNENSSNIISQIKHDDLLLEDEQKDFFNKIISYELLHIILKMETQRIKGMDNEDKKPSKI
jgi:sugar-specific transcriptional regulator TrmB